MAEKVKAKDLTNLSPDELQEKHDGLKKELFQLRLQAKLQKLTDVSNIRKAKRAIARILTVKNDLERKQNAKK